MRAAVWLSILGLLATGLAVLAVSSSTASATTHPAAHAVEPSLFAYDRSAPLDAVFGGTAAWPAWGGDVVRQDVSYRATESLRLKAFFMHPKEGGPWPLVIWSPGAGGDRRQQLPEAVTLAHAGVASLLIDAPPLYPGCRGDNLKLYVDYVVSRRRAVDLAQTLPNVDATQLAAAGFSFGSEITATLSGVDHRFVAFSLKSGRGHHTGFVRLVCTSLGKAALDAEIARLAVVEPVRWIGRSVHAATLVQNGRSDGLTPRADVLALYAAARKPKELRWYPAGHDLNAAATAYRDQWLVRHLRP